MQSSVTSTSNGFLGGSLTTFLIIAGIASVLGFSGGESSKPHDEESNDSSSEAVRKEEIRKAEANSPI